MARKKSLAQQMLDAYQAKQKAKAAALKKEAAEREREAMKAAQEQLRRKRAEALRAERERERLLAAGQRELDKQARDATRAERELAQRQAARKKEAEARERARARAAQEDARRQDAEQVQRLKEETTERSDEVQQRVAQLAGVLADRPGDLSGYQRKAEQRLVQDGPAAFAEAVCKLLLHSPLPAGCRPAVQAAYEPEAQRLLLEVDLPGQDIIPAAAGYRYVAQRREVVPVPRKDAETRDLYRQLVARLALHAIEEAFAATSTALVETVLLNGHVNTKDRATGRAVRPCLASVMVERAAFGELDLGERELDPALCLRHLNAIVSPHPYDLQAVDPVATFDLSKYRFVEEVDIVSGLDSRPDLVKMDPFAFEHLVRQLFEAIGLEAWTTQASRDDGVDAVAINRHPLTGGLCVIQAKRYKDAVSADAVRALASVMADKAAAKGILVTTSWFGQASHEFAHRTGRMQLIEGRELKALLKEHLGIDALLGLPKTPRSWNTSDPR